MTREAQVEMFRQMLAPLMGATVENEAGSRTIPADHILLDVYRDGYQACPLDVLVTMFGDALPETAPIGVFDALVAHDPDGSMGWRQHFERWHMAGLVN